MSSFRLAQVRTEQGVRDQVSGQPLPARASEHLQDATRLFSAVDAARQQLRLGPLNGMDRALDGLLPIVRQHLDELTFAQTWAEGQAMTFEQMVEYALEITRGAPPTAQRQASETVAPPRNPDLALLTPREREIVILVARGLGNRQIAEHLVVAPRTVETHVHNILGKLELTSRAQVAVWAVEHGLLAT